MSNILIIKHGSLGDIAQASGAIQDIFENHKEDKVYLLTTKPYFELFKQNPFINDVILDKRLSRFNLIYLYSLMRKIKKLNIIKVYDLQNSSRTKFYKNILFSKSDNKSWSSSETTLPNNINKEEFDQFYSYVPERVLIILDEAYFEFADEIDDYPDSMTYRYDNVITLRSFSKAYGLGGVRIGYGLAHDELISNLLKVKVPFEPSFTAQVAGIAALDDPEFLLKTIKANKQGMKFFKQELNILGVEHIPSAANFITTVWESEEQSIKLSKSLLALGVIIRQLSSFGWPNCMRISIGTEEENNRFIESLKTVL